MIREEAKKIILKHQFAFASMPYEVIKAVSYLIEEQEPILDKIRAEIEQTSETIDGFLMHDGTKRTVLQIIDKYKAESER